MVSVPLVFGDANAARAATAAVAEAGKALEAGHLAERVAAAAVRESADESNALGTALAAASGELTTARELLIGAARDEEMRTEEERGGPRGARAGSLLD